MVSAAHWVIIGTIVILTIFFVWLSRQTHKEAALNPPKKQKHPFDMSRRDKKKYLARVN